MPLEDFNTDMERPSKSLFGGRPDRERLTDGFGIEPDALLCDFLGWVYQYSGEDGDAAGDLLLQLLNLNDDPGMLYPMTPREMFSLGGNGGDGQHTGFIAWDVEWEPEERPWVYFDPMGGDASYLAPSTRVFLTQMLSFHRFVDPEMLSSSSPEAARACAERLGLTLSPEACDRRAFGSHGLLCYWEHDLPRPALAIDVPEGWRHKMTRDGIGVVAREEQFNTDTPSQLPRGTLPDECLMAARQALSRGYPGTAEALLRGTIPGMGRNEFKDYERQWLAFNEMLLETFEALDRPRLAARLRNDPMW